MQWRSNTRLITGIKLNALKTKGILVIACKWYKRMVVHKKFILAWTFSL